MARKIRLIDPQTGRKLILYEQPTHKPPATRKRAEPVVFRGRPQRVVRREVQPIYQHPEFYPYQQYTRRSKAVSWFIGVAGFFLFFVACAIHPAVTIAGWGLVTAILVYRSMKE